MDFDQLWLRCVARSWDKQMALADLLHDNPSWNFSMDSGMLSFSNGHRFKAQILGTESEISHTWLWAWANDASGIPPNLLQAPLAVKAFGSKYQIAALTTPELALDSQIDGNKLALISSQIGQGDAIYRGPYDGGAVFLFIKDKTYPKPTETPIQRIAMKFPQLIANVPLPDHRTVLQHYCQSYGLTVQTKPGKLVATAPNGKTLEASFDQLGRLSKLETILGGE